MIKITAPEGRPVLEKLLHSIKDELNTRKPYEKQQIAFVYEKDCEG